MSLDLKFSGADFDLSFTDNDIDFVDSAAEVSQNSMIRLQFIAGEQFDDTRVGMPWLTDMVNAQVSLTAKQQIIRRTILSTPNVRSLDSLIIGVDSITGIAEGSFNGTTIDSEEFGGVV
tara:strand:+ start:637 stop:993 length:357 start_codon:yes stop_codon:yes gene_type:complete